jgi:hypothetical protein
MVHFLTISATLVSVLLHGLLGCCWHHAHAAETVGLQSQKSGNCAQVSGCCAHERSHSILMNDTEQSPEREAPCDEEPCVFYVGEVKKEVSRVSGPVAESGDGVPSLFVQPSQFVGPVLTSDCHDPELLRLRLAMLQRWTV